MGSELAPRPHWLPAVGWMESLDPIYTPCQRRVTDQHFTAQLQPAPPPLRLLEGRKTGSEVTPRSPGETRGGGEQSHQLPHLTRAGSCLFTAQPGVPTLSPFLPPEPAAKTGEGNGC